MMASPAKYSSGDLVLYCGDLCVVKSVQRSVLGCNAYHISDVVSGLERTVSKHELGSFDIDEEDDLTEVDMDVEQPEQPLASTSGVARHVQLSEAEIDDVARQRLSTNTEHQTRWSVSLLKGMLIIEIKLFLLFFLCLNYNVMSSRSFNNGQAL